MSCEHCNGPMPREAENATPWGWKRYKRSDAKYCSKSCRQKASRARKAAERPCCETCGQRLPTEQVAAPARELDPAQLAIE